MTTMETTMDNKWAPPRASRASASEAESAASRRVSREFEEAMGESSDPDPDPSDSDSDSEKADSKAEAGKGKQRQLLGTVLLLLFVIAGAMLVAIGMGWGFGCLAGHGSTCLTAQAPAHGATLDTLTLDTGAGLEQSHAEQLTATPAETRREASHSSGLRLGASAVPQDEFLLKKGEAEAEVAASVTPASGSGLLRKIWRFARNTAIAGSAALVAVMGVGMLFGASDANDHQHATGNAGLLAPPAGVRPARRRAPRLAPAAPGPRVGAGAPRGGGGTGPDCLRAGRNRQEDELALEGAPGEEGAPLPQAQRAAAVPDAVGLQ